jgi:hypothetical protein
MIRMNPTMATMVRMPPRRRKNITVAPYFPVTGS